MYLKIVEMLLPLIVRQIGEYLDKKQASIEAKKKFLVFVEALQEVATTPAKLKNSYERQGEALDKIIAEIEKEKQKPLQ